MVEGTQISALENRLTELEKENFLLQEKAVFLTCKFYGRSTEQTSSLEIEGQMSFFDEAENQADPKAQLDPCQLPGLSVSDCWTFTEKKEEHHGYIQH